MALPKSYEEYNKLADNDPSRVDFREYKLDGKNADAQDKQGGDGEELRQKAIRHIYHENDNPLRAVWYWADRGKSKRARYRRWRSLQYWAQGQRDNSHGDEREKWNGRRKIYAKRKRRIYKKIHDEPDKPTPNNGVGFTTIDGRQVPNWMAPIVLKVRSEGRWHGYIVSGYRTPEYSRQLCYGMCGAPSCPGRCAGTSSNHCCPPSFTGRPYEGAIDVSDYSTFRSELQRLGLWGQYTAGKLYNALPIDLVHFSYSGR